MLLEVGEVNIQAALHTEPLAEAAQLPEDLQAVAEATVAQQVLTEVTNTVEMGDITLHILEGDTAALQVPEVQVALVLLITVEAAEEDTVAEEAGQVMVLYLEVQVELTGQTGQTGQELIMDMVEQAETRVAPATVMSVLLRVVEVMGET